MKKENYDVPIEKPFGELPAWFVSNLNSRLVTKRFTKDRQAKHANEDGSRNSGLSNCTRR